MLGIKTTRRMDAMSLLKKDHETVKKLFDRFEKADENEDAGECKSIVKEACGELKIHATVEEQLFYPALRQKLEDDDLVNEADEEHHEAKILIAELELMSGDEDNYCAKFEVLSENVRHHIKEEEGELFPAAKKTSIDFEALGEQMMELKQQLQKEGVPPDAEAEMVGEFGVAQESPSMRAKKTLTVPESERASKRARKH